VVRHPSAAPADRDDGLTLAVMALAFAASQVAAFLLLRLGFRDLTGLGLGVIGLAGLLFGAPAVLYAFTGRWGGWSGPWWRGAPFLTIALVPGLGLLGWLAAQTGFNPLPLLIVAGWICAVVVLVLWLRHGRPWASLLFLLFAVFFAQVVLTGRHPALLPEMLISESGGHIDNAFHASLANMRVIYGVPSTGLDGTPLLAYHDLSHWLIGHMGTLLGGDAPTMYALAYPALIAPLALVAISGLAVVVRRRLWPAGRAHIPLRRDVVFWGLLALGVFSALPKPLWAGMGMDPERLFRSESLALGVAFTLLGAAMLLAFTDAWWARPRQPSPMDALFLLAVLPLLAILVGTAKSSQLAIAVPVAGWLWWRLRLYRQPLWVVAAALTGLATALTYTAVSLNDPNYARLVPMAFFAQDVSALGILLFVPLGFAWSWAAIFLLLRRAGARRARDLPAIIRDRRALVAEALVVAVVAAIAIVAVLALPHRGSALFLDFQRWLAVPIVMGMASTATWALPGRRRSIGVVALAIAAAVLLGLNIALRTTMRLESNTLLPRTLLMAQQQASAAGQSPQAARAAALGWDGLAPVMAELAAWPLAEKRDALLYIPRDVTAYWGHRPCREIPFFAPALTGIALIDGLPADDCEDAQYYGYGIYAGLRDAARGPLDPAALCAGAARWGMRWVAIISPAPGGGYAVQRLDCGGAAAPPS
jgi:hypothetical protein